LSFNYALGSIIATRIGSVRVALATAVFGRSRLHAVPLRRTAVARTTFTLISRTLVVAALGMLSAGVASGAAFRLSFDPQFSLLGSFDNLGFAGDGVVMLDDHCLDSTGQLIVGSGGCTFANFTSLNVDLFNFTDDPLLIGAPLEIVPFVPPLNPTITAVVSQVVLENGELAALDTPFFGPRFAGAVTGGSGPDPLPDDSNLFLQFVSNWAFNSTTQTFTFHPEVFLKICDLENDNCSVSNPATVSFTRITEESVPEPASILLLLGALGVFGWVQYRGARG
jgi:hypothetical protein